MKNIIQNLLKYRTSTILNIIGLSSAFAVFIIISMQIRYDISFDKYNENYDSIYQLAIKDTIKGERGFNFNRQYPIRFKDAISEIEYISVLGSKFDDRLSLVNEDGQVDDIIAQNIKTCNSDITKIFTFEFIEGNEIVLNDPANIIISEEFAKRYYGEISPIGRKIRGSNKDLYTIAAVYKTFPRNGSLQGDIFCNIGNENLNQDGNWNYQVYLKSHENTDQNGLNSKMLGTIPEADRSDSPMRFDSIELSDVRYIYAGYNRNILYIMIIIVLAIIVLASINFVNFATSMIPLKIKGINVRKVLGAESFQLRRAMIFEALFLSSLSFLIAIGIVEIFKESTLSSIINDSSWDSNKIIYLIAFGISILAAVFSSLYPAFYSTSFPPALILKSSFALSARGGKFRKALIGFQFLVAISFISMAIFIQLQHNHLINRDSGYVKDAIILVNQGVSFGYQYDKHEVLKEELFKNPQIEDITFSHSPFGTSSGFMSWGMAYSKGNMSLLIMVVAPNFLDFFDIGIDKGRNFMLSDKNSPKGYFITSKIAMSTYDLEMEEKIGWGRDIEILGVCENVHITNMKTELKPYAFLLSGEDRGFTLRYAYIKASGDPQAIIKQIERAYIIADPNSVVEVKYLSEEIERAYKNENTFKKIMQSFSLIAIIIALVGVFGLVAFDTRFRRREISLRRINGASIANILTMFSGAYIKILLISFIISLPIVYFAIKYWLSFFPYAVPIYWWVFAISLLSVMFLTVVITIFQTLTAAKENPVNILK